MSCVCAIGGGKTKTYATSGHHVMFETIGGYKNQNKQHKCQSKTLDVE